jgi:uncharacterized membrane protein
MGINGSGNCITKFIYPAIARLPAIMIIIGIIFDQFYQIKKSIN